MLRVGTFDAIIHLVLNGNLSKTHANTNHILKIGIYPLR